MRQGHACIAVAGPVARPITVETGDSDGEEDVGLHPRARRGGARRPPECRRPGPAACRSTPNSPGRVRVDDDIPAAHRRALCKRLLVSRSSSAHRGDARMATTVWVPHVRVMVRDE